ncbi:MAG: NAD(P) transhydrogenase subunit alpha [Pseudohongiellaceae bacterium]|jgi:NAD(P) transhydrogenase subunit alpha
MRVVVPLEVFPGEQRVAATPATVALMVKMGFDVSIQAGAGASARYPDDEYAAAGATLVDDVEQLWAAGDIVLKVCPPGNHPGLDRSEVELLKEGALLICFMWPSQNGELLATLAQRNVSVYAMDQVPRVSRAQKMDALSSMSNIVGYRAVIEAANHFGRFFTGQITAAGKVAPAKVLVIGAGVAGLAAIAAARGLGAVVRAFDTRLEVKEQITSLGGEFLELDFEESGEGGGGYAKVMSDEFLEAERELFRQQAKEVDIVITTALIPGKKAPLLWEADMVAAMRPGSVVVDLASVQGGNCELTSPGEVVVKHGVTIVGHEDLTSRLATTASQLYSTNLINLLDDMGGAESFSIDMEDVVVRGGMVTHEGQVCWPPPPPPDQPAAAMPSAAAIGPAAKTAASEPASDVQGTWVGADREAAIARFVGPVIGLALAGGWIMLRNSTLGESASQPLIDFSQHLTVFVLACFVGWQLIWNVTPALHTPLMSVTNAISGIIILGGLLEGTKDSMGAAVWLGTIAALFAMINVTGGFLVSQRMLRMFRRDTGAGA